MSFEVVLLNRAQKDFARILDWLATHSPDVLSRWFDAYERILDRLERESLSFGFAPEKELLNVALRQAILRTGKGYTYRVLFLVIGQQVRILHIRGPGQDFVADTN